MNAPLFSSTFSWDVDGSVHIVCDQIAPLPIFQNVRMPNVVCFRWGTGEPLSSLQRGAWLFKPQRRRNRFRVNPPYSKNKSETMTRSSKRGLPLPFSTFSAQPKMRGRKERVAANKYINAQGHPPAPPLLCLSVCAHAPPHPHPSSASSSGTLTRAIQTDTSALQIHHAVANANCTSRK